MKHLRRKISITLFTFLALFSLAVNLIAFSILTKYNYKHYEQLAMLHMEQQYQNLQQRLAVIGENIRLFCENEQFVGLIEEEDWYSVGIKMGELLQSTSGIVGGRGYLLENGQFKLVTGSTTSRYTDPDLEDLLDRLESQNTNLYRAEWFLRESTPGNYECLSYLLPVYHGEALLGVFLADVNVKQLGEELMDYDSKQLWQAAMLIRSSDGNWSSQPPDQLLQMETLFSENQMEIKEGGRCAMTHELPQSGDFAVQIVTLDIAGIFFPLGLTLSGIFIVSLVFFFWLTRFVTGSIIDPLNEIQNHMSQTLHEK